MSPRAVFTRNAPDFIRAICDAPIMARVSALSGVSGQLAVNLEFNRQVFGPNPPTIGDAILRAKAATANGDVRRTWILFGDPTMKLK